jgi:hypothetical protein
MRITVLLALLFCVACVVPVPQPTGLKPPGATEEPEAIPAVYMRGVVRADNLTVGRPDPNNPEQPKCSYAKLCADALKSCRCTSDGRCENWDCEDELLARYCFCAWAERP